MFVWFLPALSYGQQMGLTLDQELIVETFPSPHQRHVYSDDFKSTFPALFSIVNFARRWDPGSSLNACFYEGAKEVNIRVAELAVDWLDGVNLRVNFIDTGGELRNCRSPQIESSSQIRIGFSCRESWALLGTEASDPNVTSPPQGAAPLQTVNLSEVQQDKVSDAAFRRDVLHEFGHVLAFYHEHMRCAEEYDYDVMFDWLRRNRGMNDEQIKRNFYLPIEASDRAGDRPVLSTEIDRLSIEFYSMPAFFFKKGSASPCYVSPLPTTLSLEDRRAAREAYPSDPEQIAAIRDQLNNGLTAVLSQVSSTRLALLLNQPNKAFDGFSYSAGTRHAAPVEAATTRVRLDELRAAETQLRTRLA